MTVIESTEGGYEIQDVELGKVYKWSPENVTLECDCGEKLNLTGLQTTCEGCGADHAAIVQEELDTQRQLEDKASHPWRYDQDREDAGLPC